MKTSKRQNRRLRLRACSRGRKRRSLTIAGAEDYTYAMAKTNGYTGSYTLPFEQPVIDLEKQITALQEREDAASYAEELSSLSSSRDSLLAKLYR